MEYKVTTSVTTKTPLLWLCPSEFEEGLQYAKENDIKALFLWYKSGNPEILTLDFSWLEQLTQIESIECMLSLSSKSNIESFYNLNHLTSLVYFNYDKLPLNHARLPNLRRLYTHYSKQHLTNNSRFELLPKLERLKLWHIKNQIDCSFLENSNGINHLELTWSRTIKSLHGIEKLNNLETLHLRNLYTLGDVSSIAQCSKLTTIWTEGCKHIEESGRKLIEEINIRSKQDK